MFSRLTFERLMQSEVEHRTVGRTALVGRWPSSKRLITAAGLRGRWSTHTRSNQSRRRFPAPHCTGR